MVFRFWVRLLAALCGLLLLAAAIAHERAAERCLERGGRWQPTHFSCGSRSAGDARGVALRAAIDAEFRHRRDARLLHGQDGDRNLISPVVEASIPPGTALAEAARLLRAAGFQVEPAHPCRADDPQQGQCQNARIDDYAFALFGSTAVQVQLEAEQGSAVVRGLSAEIVVERLL